MRIVGRRGVAAAAVSIALTGCGASSLVAAPRMSSSVGQRTASSVVAAPTAPPDITALRRAAASATWVVERGPGNASFALPQRVEARQNKTPDGTTEVLFIGPISEHDGLSVSFINPDGAVPSTAYAQQYFDSLVTQFRQAGSTDAVVDHRATSRYQGALTSDARVHFTPQSEPRLPVVWFLRIVQTRTSIIVVQTILFPLRRSPDYESVGRTLQQRLTSSIDF